MYRMTATCGTLTRSFLLFLFLALSAGCARTQVQPDVPVDYVEIPNPALTMSPNAPEKIWVPRASVDRGVPRGGELVKRGYEAVKGGSATSPRIAPDGAAVTPPQAGVVAPEGKPATVIPRFGLVVAVDGDKVYFNLGREAGITPFQKLKVYRGGTVIEGLGLAPGEVMATIEVQGFVGTNGAYGLIKQGGQLRINDLVGAE